MKVHFDKFSGAGINQPSPLSNHPSEHNRNGGGSYRQDGPPLPQYPHQNQQSNAQIGRDSSRGPSNYPSSEQQRQQQEYMAQQQRQQQGQQGGGAQFAYSAFQGTGEALQRDLSSRPGTAQAPIGSPSPSLQARQPPTMSGENGPTTSSSIEPTTGSSSSGTQPTSSTSSGTSPSLLRQNAGAPSRIAMPPPLPFGNGNNGPFSPMRTNLPPMTPSMPAFTFGGFSAQTPPIHPHALFSPGIGPFSPQMGSPFFGPGQGMGHFQNVAPGTLFSLDLAILDEITHSLIHEYRSTKSRIRFQSHVPSFPSYSQRTSDATATTSTAASSTTTTARTDVPNQRR